MRGQVAVGVQPAEVHDAPRSRLTGRVGEPRGQRPVTRNEVAFVVHGVQEVVRHVGPVQRTAQDGGVGGIPLGHLDAVDPGAVQ